MELNIGTILNLSYGIASLILLVAFMIPGKAWKILKVQEIGTIVNLNQRTRLMIESVLIHVYWPFQKLVKTSTAPSMIVVGTITIAIGGNDPTNLTIHNTYFRFYVTDPDKAAFDTPGANPAEALRADFLSAATQATTSIDLRSLTTSGGIATLEQRVKEILLESAVKYGCTISAVSLPDVELPTGLVDATDQRLKASGYRDAERARSEAEVERFQRERRVQGDMYLPLQFFDRLREMAQEGAFQYVGDMSGLMAWARNLQEGLQGESQPGADQNQSSRRRRKKNRRNPHGRH